MFRRLGCVRGLALLAVVVAVAHCALADTLKLKDGRTYEGKLVSRDMVKILFRIEKNGVNTTMEFALTDVDSVTVADAAPAAPPPAGAPTAGGNAKPAPPPPPQARTGTGVPYYVLPIRGVFGLQVSNTVVRECFDTARELGAKVIVLDIDSPGGQVSELNLLLRTMDRYRDIRTVAYVRQAKSAAAVLAMGCREIIMADGAQIGAAVPFVRGPDGTPKNIEAKFEASIRADFRSAAERGGHEPLLMEGMVRDDIVLSLGTSADGKPTVVEGQPAGTKVLKRTGEILCLTTQQAIGCGLALGKSDSLADCRRLLNIPEWFDLSDHGRQRCAAWTSEIEKAEDEFHKAWQNVEAGLVDARAGIAAKKRTAATNALLRAERNLQKMADLAGKYPGLGDDDSFETARAQIHAARKALEK